jgi:ABC-2 type transport system permease protein
MDPELVQRGVPLYTGNQEFFQNIVDYMMGDNSVLDIRSRQIEIKKIDKEKIKQFAGFYKLVNVIVPIGIILLLAFLLNLIRKNRFAKTHRK